MILYHYTSQAGLFRIIKSKSIWTTNILYQNDAREFFYSIELACKYIATLQKNNKKHLPSLGKIDKHIKLIKELNLIPTVYAFSLSHEGDLLSQWRAYCPKSGGFSIGFDSKYLEKATKQQKFELLKCNYAHPNKTSLITKLIDRYLQKDHNQFSIQNFQDELFKLMPQIKDPAFKAENEWRLIGHIPDPWEEGISHRYRESSSVIIPYYEVKLAGCCHSIQLEKIIVGPTRHPKLTCKSVGEFLQFMRVTKTYENYIAPVQCSQILFRADL